MNKPEPNEIQYNRGILGVVAGILVAVSSYVISAGIRDWSELTQVDHAFGIIGIIGGVVIGNVARSQIKGKFDSSKGYTWYGH